MILLGITGGIGSGKSVVAQIFESMEIPVYYVDIAAKRISNSYSRVKKKLSDRFGPSLYKKGVLNRDFLASLIFNNLEHLAFVNSVIHPEVLNNFLCWGKKYKKKLFVAIESAILFESSFDKYVDVSINVFAPKILRIKRIQIRSGLDEQSIFSRMKNQLSEKELAKKADFTIVNSCSSALLPQVEKLLNNIQTFVN